MIKLSEIDSNYYYEGNDLGYSFNDDVHTFKVWSPLATEVKLCIYNHYDTKTNTMYKMEKNEVGVWQVFIREDINGKYYNFLVNIDGVNNEVVDPYARALCINGEKGAIIKIEQSNPEGWFDHIISKITKPTDACIYELHIRDLSIDNNSGIKNKGKFLGICQENTISNEGVKTGLSHIKDLGVTHVQLLPIFDYGSIDERKSSLMSEYENSNDYNWGYDPINYNAPEGSYSTNPYNPINRIKELKTAIKTLHENGLGVIMDVVYNHMLDVNKSSFDKLMPGYYFRYDEEGVLCNESGCGNAIASENKMVRKFIVDSVKFWATEYKLDGFRFDLMGLLDVQTMNEIKKELYKINPAIIILGEGWNMGNSLQDTEKSIQLNAYKLRDIAFFNDDIRDTLRGSYCDLKEKGFLNGANNLELKVKKGIVGGINYSNNIITWGEVEPNQVVNYIECHDNNTLYDRLKINEQDEDKIKYMSRLGMSIILLSQGIPFIHAGQEFLRTKYGVENSYKSNDSINKLDWKTKYNNMDTVKYCKGLIKLRKNCSAFRMETSEEIRQSLRFIAVPNNAVAYIIEKENSYGQFNKIIVIHNANTNSIKINTNINLDWKVVVNKYKSGIETLKVNSGSKFIIEGLETLVAYN
jgi:pullulanase